MKWGDVLTDVNAVQTGPQVIFAVAQAPNAFGITSAGMVDNRVYSLRLGQRISQSMRLVTRGDPTAVMAKVIEAVRLVGRGGDKGI